MLMMSGVFLVGFVSGAVSYAFGSPWVKDKIEKVKVAIAAVKQ